MAPSSSSFTPTFDVFISHAEEDKATIAIPLRDMLRSQGKTAFVHAQDIPPGTDADRSIITAMEHAKVGVIILSPEFVARRGTMKELLYFLRRIDDADKSRKPPPIIIIPVFYRLSIQESEKEPCFTRLNRLGNSLYHESQFLRRMENGEPEAQTRTIKEALEKLRRIMSVTYDAGATDEMTDPRKWIIENTCKAVMDKVEEQVVRLQTGVGSAAVGEASFLPRFHVERNIHDLVLDFDKQDTDGVTGTLESNLLEAVVDDSEGGPSVISVHGIAGVGKTSMIYALSSLDRVTQHFKDGVYLLSLGSDANMSRLTNQLSIIVERSGDEQTAKKIQQDYDLRDKMEYFRSRFAERRCLFMIDDIWKCGEISAAVIQQLLTLHTTGKGSKVLFTTRSTAIASEPSSSLNRYFLLEPKDPLSSESRDILTRYAGIIPDESNVKDNDAVSRILAGCGGLPLFLAIAGKTVRATNVMRGSRGCSAYHIYASRLDESMQSLLSTDLGAHEKLRATLSLSIQLLEERMNRSNLGFAVSLTASEMFRRLCVMEKLVRVPMRMLRNLWELENEKQASIVAWEFEQMGLVDLEIQTRDDGVVDVLYLHDSLLLFAADEATGHETVAEIHDRLLNRYGSVDSELWSAQEQRVMWWSTRLDDDGYIHASLCRHLKEANRISELVELLMTPEWISRQLEVSDILRMDTDFGLGIEAKSNEDERNESADETALKLVRGALKLSSGFISRNIRELWFQLYGRLISHKDVSAKISRFLDRMEKRAGKLWLRCLSWFLAGPGGSSRVIPIGAPISKMSLIENQNRAVFGSVDGRVFIVNLNRAKIERQWLAHENMISAIANGKGGDVLVTGSLDGVAKVWDARTGTFMNHYHGHATAVICVALVDDDRRVVSASRDGAVHMWDLETGQVVGESFNTTERREREGIMFRDGTLTQLGESTLHAMFADGTHIVSGEIAVIRVWRLPDGLQVAQQVVDVERGLRVLPLAQRRFNEGVSICKSGCICNLAVTPDGKRVLVADIVQETVIIWNIEDGEQIAIPRQRYIAPNDYPRCISIRDDGNRFATGSEGGPIRLWDTSGHRFGEPYQGHTAAVTDMAFLSSSDSLVSCSLDENVRIWDLRTMGQGIPEPNRRLGWYPEILILPGEVVHLPRSSSYMGAPSALTFTPDGMHVVSASNASNALFVWDASSGEVCAPTLVADREVTGLAVFPNRHHLVTVSCNDRVRFWRWGTIVGHCKDRMGFMAGIERSSDLVNHDLGGLQAVALAPQSDYMITGSLDGALRFFYVVPEDERGDIEVVFLDSILLGHSCPIMRVFISDDGSRVISVAYEREKCGADTEIRVWELEKRRCLKEIKRVDAWRLSRRGILELVGEMTEETEAGLSILLRDREIKYGHGETEEVVATMEAPIARWAMSPDNKTLCVGLENQQIAIMRIENPRETTE